MDTGFISKKENPTAFLRLWLEYVTINQISPLYLPTNIDYLSAYSGPLVADESFVYCHGGQITACAFIPVENRDGHISITSAGSFVPAPHFLTISKKIETVIMDHIDEIASRYQVEKIMFRIDPLERILYPYNYLLNYDYLDASLLGYLVTANSSSMRRNHERAIRKIEQDKTISLSIMDKNNADYAIHESYRELHHKCASRVTRPKITFNLQYQMLTEGNSVLVYLKKDEQMIAATYFTYSGGKAISYSAADDPAWSHLPLYHIINARAIKYLNQQAVTKIDLGQPLNTSNQLFCFPDKKQKNISLFKTGFAGEFVNNFRGVKYFHPDAFAKDIKDFSQNYQSGININI